MGTQIEILARVKRVFEGRGSIEDLSQIFIYIRERSHGRKAIRDIGDFVAHGDERCKGLAWEDLNSIYRSLIILTIVQLKQPAPKELVISHLESTMNLEDSSMPKRLLNIGQRKAHRELRQIFDKISHFDGEKLIYSGSLTERGQSILMYYFNRAIVRPVYSGLSIQNELTQVLKKNNLFPDGYTEIPSEVLNQILMYVMVRMHNSIVKFGIDNEVKLQLSRNSINLRGMGVHASLSLKTDLGVSVLQIDVLATEIIPEIHCTKRLLDIPDHLWIDHPIEINKDGHFDIID